ncbi:uncharacterized protein LOC128233876 [Mya arenaria]|uniref:uncharacterized protein LOC128233876 n=1 Tax=Mya arenaria TaxID=6604 RepID=UPI0022E7ABDA|nr:uncharacterized protein LOC128233876 [Mya arenaria]
MHNSWIRIVRQVNYRRSFPTPTSARVEIPCIPYEAFDHTGNVTPKGLLSLIESITACTFWRNTSTSEPERCFLKIHDLLENHLMFMASVRLTITDRSLYDSTVVKQP